MSDLYGSMVFDDRVMSKRLPKDTYRELKRSVSYTHLTLPTT